MTVSDTAENTVGPHSPFDIVALVASAGGLEALNTVLRPIPADFPAKLVVVQHLPATASQLVDILRRLSVRRVSVTRCPHRARSR